MTVGDSTHSEYCSGLTHQIIWATNMVPLGIAIPPDWSEEDARELMRVAGEVYERVRRKQASRALPDSAR